MKFARKVLREDVRRHGKMTGEKALRLLVISSLVAMQSLSSTAAAASLITRVDGTQVDFKDGVADVYAEKVQGDLGINRFTDFSIAEKNTANMYFKENAGGGRSVEPRELCSKSD